MRLTWIVRFILAWLPRQPAINEFSLVEHSPEWKVTHPPFPFQYKTKEIDNNKRKEWLKHSTDIFFISAQISLWVLSLSFGRQSSSSLFRVQLVLIELFGRFYTSDLLYDTDKTGLPLYTNRIFVKRFLLKTYAFFCYCHYRLVSIQHLPQ